MKKIGREVCMLTTSEKNARNGEGAFIRLSNGKIMYAYSRYNTDDKGDHGKAVIAAVFSNDDGETWGENRDLFTNTDVNNMCVSLMHMNNGDIGLFYGCKYLSEDKRVMMKVLLRRSADEGETWSQMYECMDEEGYFVYENDRIFRLKSGRILLPLNLHEAFEKGRISNKGVFRTYYSDDDGYTWKTTGKGVYHPFEGSQGGLQETGFYQYEDGRVWAYSRTWSGNQYSCYSDDDGVTWTTPTVGEFFTSPPAPMNVKRINDKYTVAIFNPIPNYPGREAHPRTWGRTPLVCAVSTDDAKSFGKVFAIEDDPQNGYCYPSILAGEDYILVAYYHSNGGNIPLNCCKITKVPLSELEAEINCL